MAQGQNLNSVTAKMICFTTAANRDLPKVRVLAKSIRQFHLDWPFYVVLTEPLARSVDPAQEDFSILRFDELPIARAHSWIFMHNRDEARLAIKGPAIHHFLYNLKVDKILYLDASAVVFNPLAGVNELLDKASICLVPQYTRPARGREQILRRDVTVLREGSFDLRFLALKNDGQGRSFANWWRERLLRYCYQNDERGIYFDQKWCNLIPALFDSLHIIRDPSYNVNVKNLPDYRISRTMNGWVVGGRPMKVFQFSDRGELGDHENQPNKVAQRLYEWYKSELLTHGQGSLGTAPWVFDTFDNGKLITDEMRWTYRQRPDLRQRYPQPFDTDPGHGGLYAFFVWQESQVRNA